jgi:hypothetical protein
MSTKLLDNVSRRKLLLCGLSTLATGCAEIPIIVNAAKAVKMITFGDSDAEISRDQVSKIPYATISAKVGRGPKSLLVLAKKERGRLHWMSADNAVLVTMGGRIVQTAGFPENINYTMFTGHDPVNRRFHLKNPPIYSAREIDIEIDHRFGIPIHSRYISEGAREISVAQVKIQTLLVKEYNVAKTLNWSFTNYYWVDKFDGFVWKSRQHIARSFPPIEIEVLKPLG